MKLKDYCIKEGITLKSVADSLGMPYNHFAHCASGFARFSYARAKLISDFCNGEVTVDDLIPFQKKTQCPTCNRVMLKPKKLAGKKAR